MKSEAVLVRKVAVGSFVSLLLLAGCGGGTGPSSINQPTSTGPNPPVPTIQVLFPNCAPAGEPVQLQVVGTNFAASSVVRWNGSARPTTMDAINGLLAQISASDVASAGTAAVTVFNPGPSGGSSNALTFTINVRSCCSAINRCRPCGKVRLCGEWGLRWRRVHVHDQPHHRGPSVHRTTCAYQ